MKSINSLRSLGKLDNAVVPTFEKIVYCFKGVEEMASRGGIMDAVRHLYRAKRRLLIAHAEHCRSNRRQTLAKEYFMTPFISATLE